MEGGVFEMKFYFLSSIYNLEVEKVLNRGINVINGIRLSNSKSRLDTYIDDFFKTLAGKLEVDELYDKPFLYYEGNISSDIDIDNGEQRLKFLDRYLRLAQTFSNYLWIIKDNSVTVQQGFLYIKTPDGKPHSMTSNMRTPVFFNAKTESIKTKFTHEELNEIANSLWGMKHENLDKENDEISNVINTQSNRIERFDYFLQTTRTQTHLPNKIAMYCTLLETLLSTDKDEITHKIAERLARIIGKTYEERIEIFTFVKQAYAVRSSAVHGDKISRKYKDIQKLKELSAMFDNYVRELYLYILSDEQVKKLYREDNNENLNEWFKEITLK